MTASPLPSRPRLRVIAKTVTVPAWRLEEAEAELRARRSEEQEAAEAVLPYLRRLELFLQDSGPAGWQTFMAVATWHTRHARRWADEGPDAA